MSPNRAGSRDRTGSIPDWKSGAPPIMRYLLITSKGTKMTIVSTWQDLNLRALVPKTSEINRTPLHVDLKREFRVFRGF